MKTQKRITVLAIFFNLILINFNSYGISELSYKTSFDTIPVVDEVNLDSNLKPTYNESRIYFTNGQNIKGVINKFESDSLYMLSKKEAYKFDIAEINSIKIYKTKSNSFGGAMIGIVLGAIPGIIIANRESKCEGILCGLDNLVSGIAIGMGGAFAGGIIGGFAGRGVSVIYPIDGDKEQYYKQKEHIINDAIKSSY